MSKFLDRIVATGRSELAGSRLGSARPAPVALQPAAPADSVVESEHEARETIAPAPSHPQVNAPGASGASGAPGAPTPTFAAFAAPSARAADVPVHASAPEPSPVAAQRVAAQRAVGHAQALAGAWLEAPAAPRPQTPARSLPPATASPDDRAAPRAAPRPTQTASPADGPAHADARRPAQTAAAMAPLSRHDRRETAAPIREDRGAPAANLIARSTPAAPPPIAPHRAPAPPSGLHIDQLEVRIVGEPPQRAPAPSAPTVRAPSQLGAWRPSARRFLRRP